MASVQPGTEPCGSVTAVLQGRRSQRSRRLYLARRSVRTLLTYLSRCLPMLIVQQPPVAPLLGDFSFAEEQPLYDECGPKKSGMFENGSIFCSDPCNNQPVCRKG